MQLESGARPRNIRGSAYRASRHVQDVRALSAGERDYWSKLFHLSSYQQHLIWVACYRGYRADRVKTVCSGSRTFSVAATFIALATLRGTPNTLKN